MNVIHYLIINHTGLVVGAGSAMRHYEIRTEIGERYVPIDAPISHATRHALIDGEIVAISDAPDHMHEWDGATWVDAAPEGYREGAAWMALRAERTRRLVESDYRNQSDYPQSDEARAAWRAYRQALRDLPEATVDPAKVEWPDPPTLA